MTDNEIIKALECCLCDNSECLQCQNKELCRIECDELATKTIDLINRQQAEIENLKVENQSLRTAANSLKMHYEEAQAEVERLKDANNTFEKAFHIQEQNIKDWLPITVFNYEIKTEAYKECLAKVKNYIKTHCNPYGKPDFDYDTSIKILNFIDKLAKEMVGDDNA